MGAAEGFAVEGGGVSGPVAAQTLRVSAGHATARDSSRRAAFKSQLDIDFLNAVLNMAR